jgi:hypothetical protein
VPFTMWESGKGNVISDRYIHFLSRTAIIDDQLTRFNGNPYATMPAKEELASIEWRSLSGPLAGAVPDLG